uniref:GAF domain-containing protein n=1 Tax=uncultured Thiotrichaceae bacterium TaxID=298394 RepID=A0A6S6U2R4_9GAMM|nr:MAG: Unknown protein [uncultured Thiotrichaceae bacterium]
MHSTFAGQLKNFAYAVDIIDEESYQDIRDLILDYSRRVLDIDFTRQLVLSEVDGEQALMPYGPSIEGKYISISMRNNDGQLKTQAAYSLANDCPLWIISDDPEHLHLSEANAFKDLWKGATDIPTYRYPSGEKRDVPIKTSILIPLRLHGQVTGVLNFETQEHLEITKMAKAELKLIAEAISLMYGNMKNHRQSVNHTAKAIAELNNTLQHPLPKLTKPRLFLASSQRANGDVVEVIKAVLDEHFSDHLTLVYWKDMAQPGNINTQLLEVLGKCRYGICYLSEPIEDSNLYIDNPNVIFEAGMLHGRSEIGHKFPASWVPVREKTSNIPPFDLTSERMVVIERDEAGEIDNVDELKALLIKRFEMLLA